MVSVLGQVKFPEFTGQREYMRGFTKKSGLPNDLERWTDTIAPILENIDSDDMIYLTIDQKFIKAGNHHRRGGLHIDQYWIDSMWKGGGGWVNNALHEPQGIILATDKCNSVGFVGDWSGRVGEGGSVSENEIENMQKVFIEPNNVYFGNVGFVHETLPVEKDTERTLIRLITKNWEYAGI